MDGVVVFYDILFLAEAMGAPLEFTEQGPIFSKPLRSEGDLQTLHAPDLESMEPKQGTGAIVETIRMLRRTLPPRTAVIGFAGAPFTVAAYLTEGSFGRHGETVRRLLYERPKFLHELLQRLTSATAEYLCAQVDAGADVVQVFDTWAGVLPAEAYREFALPYQKEIFQRVRAAGCPTILYVNGCSHLLQAMADSGARVLSIDWRQPLGEARASLGRDVGLQGNLDPSALFQPEDGVRRSCRAVLSALRDDPGYVFNLGHGVLPETPVVSVEALVEEVRRG
jgi:uroporphyrinogen decarboxylase